MSEELNFNNICRVCCLEGNMMSLFKVHISKKLMACASIQVWQNDELPNQICTKCVSKLHIAFQFKKQCEKSDAKLRNYLQQMQEKQITNKFDIQQVQLEHQQIIHTDEHQVPEQQQQQQNDYVYVECTPNESRQYDQNVSTQIIHHTHSQLTYGTTQLNTIQQIPGTYPIQSVHVPTAVQFQTYNVPVQIPQTNHLLTLGQLTSVTAPLQPIITNQNTIPGLQQTASNDEKRSIMKLSSAKKLVSSSNYLKLPIKLKRDLDTSKVCQICGKEFTSSPKLSRHMKIHSCEMAYRCNVCLKGFSHSGNFKVHMRMHNNERPYKCTMCDKACRQQQDLEKHLRTHTKEKPYLCKICLKGFSTSSNLIAHTRIHNGEKPYICSVCQKAFCQSNELTKHTKTHTGEKSHFCKICQKGFNGSSTLVVHMRSHTKERPYICNVCQKGFTQSSCLQVHMKRHKLEKNFICDICSCSFITNADLKEHSLTHNTDNKQYGCNICDKRYSRANDLNKHAKTHSL